MTFFKSFSFCVAFALMLGPAVTSAQIGGALKDKAKNATNAKSNSKNDSKSSTNPSDDKTERAPAEDNNRDEYGVLVSDPAIDAAVKDKNAFYMTQTSDLYRYLNTKYKQGTGHFLKRVVADVTPETLNLTFVNAKQNGSGAFTEDIAFTKSTDNYYYHSSSNIYALVQPDNSIVLFQGGSLDGAELLVKEEAAAKAATADELKKSGNEHKAKIKAKEKEETEKKNAAGNVSVYQNEVKATHSNAALESQFMKLLNGANATAPEADKATWTKIMLKSNDWTVEKNDLGQPVKQSYVAWAVGKYTKDQRCFFHKVYFKKDYLGGGQYSDVKFDEAQRPSVIPCDIVK
ncbi:MAG TPA: hypothetical protein VEY71_00280 [Chitinophagales bacterium]|nr:hypothetical protein [Chitinophagales bacterium]